MFHLPTKVLEQVPAQVQGQVLERLQQQEQELGSLQLCHHLP